MNAGLRGVGSGIYRMSKLDPETLNGIFVDCEVMSSEDINAVFTTANLGDLALIRAVHSSRDCRSMRVDRHICNYVPTQIFACIPINGRLGVNHLGRSCVIEQGALTLLSTDHEYAIDMADDLDALWLRMPWSSLQSYSISIQDTLCRPIDVSGGIGLTATQLILTSISAAHGNLSHRGASLLSQSLLGIMGELIDITLCDVVETSTRHKRKILVRARDYIEANIGNEDLSPQLIADTIGISRRYLSQIFASEGTSVMRWVQKRRLERCHAEITSRSVCKQPIQEIAYSLGFANISSFNRAFKAQYGHSPRSLIAEHSDTTSLRAN